MTSGSLHRTGFVSFRGGGHTRAFGIGGHTDTLRAQKGLGDLLTPSSKNSAGHQEMVVTNMQSDWRSAIMVAINKSDTYQAEDIMTDERTLKEIDPMIPRSVWYPMLWEFFLRLAESYSEIYRLAAVRLEAEALEQLGDARRSAIQRIRRHLHGVLTQDLWHRQGFNSDEMYLDEDGDVVVVKLPKRFFGSEKPHLMCLVNGWVTADESFSSPDGSPVYQAEDLARLKATSDAEQIEFLNSKLH